MKVLLINDYGFEAGGAEVIVFTLRDALRQRGHEVKVFASAASNRRQLQRADELCDGSLDERRTNLQCLNLSAFIRLREVVKFFKPDVAHVNLYLTQLSPLILRALGNVPTIYYAQWYRLICPVGTRLLPSGDCCRFNVGFSCLDQGCIPRHYWPQLMAQMALNRAWLGRFNKISAISQNVANRLIEFAGPSIQNVEVVYPGTRCSSLRLDEEQSLTPMIVFAGRLVPEKGIDVLIKAFALIHSQHHDIQLRILGDGPSLADLMALSHRLSLTGRVVFDGHLSQQTTSAVIRRCWCLCVPSLWEEPFGMIAAEAQMQGIPVIASSAGGLKEIIADGITGFLVPPGDVSALANRLHLLVSDRSLARRLGYQANMRAAELFGSEAFATRFETIYSHMLHSSRD